MRKSLHTHQRRSFSLRRYMGFSLLEVLIALVILSVGLLGLAALQAEGLRGSSNALMRYQASRLTGDIIDRMRANPAGTSADNYEILSTQTATQSVVCAEKVGTVSSTCTPAQMAAYDLFLWRADLTALLPQSTSSITKISASKFAINVGWNDRGSALDVTTEVQFYDYK